MQLGLCNWKNTQTCVIKCLLQAHPTRLAWTLVWEVSHTPGMGQLQDGILLLPQMCYPFLGWLGRKGSLQGAAQFQGLVGAIPVQGNWAA